MTQLIKDLLADGLIVELEQAPSNGGRPARMLGLAASAGRAIGVKVVADHVAFVEVGIDGRVLRSASEPFDALVEHVPHRARRPDPPLHRGRHGRHPPRRRRRRPRQRRPARAAASSMRRSSAGARSSSATPCAARSTCPSSSRTTSTPSPWQSGSSASAASHDNFLVVTIGTGVGAGIVVDGSVLRAASGGAGEIGHIPITDDGPRCSCGNDGCLEAYIGEAALVARARGRRASMSAAAGVAVASRGRRGGRRAAPRASSARPGALLGRTLAGVVHTIDPAFVVVLGEGTAAWRHWSYGFEPAFRSHLLPPPSQHPGRGRDVAGRELGAGRRGARARHAVRRGRRSGRPGPAHPRPARRAGRPIMSALRRRGRRRGRRRLARDARGRTAPAAAAPPRSPYERRYALTVLAFLLPSAIPLVLFVLGPMVAAAWISLTEWNLLAPAKWVGLDNYATLLTDPETGDGLPAHRLLHRRLPAARLRRRARDRPRAEHRAAAAARFLRGVYFLPVITSWIVVALVWRWLLNPEQRRRQHRARASSASTARDGGPTRRGRCRRSSSPRRGRTSASSWSSCSPGCRRSTPNCSTRHASTARAGGGGCSPSRCRCSRPRRSSSSSSRSSTASRSSTRCTR